MRQKGFCDHLCTQSLFVCRPSAAWWQIITLLLTMDVLIKLRPARRPHQRTVIWSLQRAWWYVAIMTSLAQLNHPDESWIPPAERAACSTVLRSKNSPQCSGSSFVRRISRGLSKMSNLFRNSVTRAGGLSGHCWNKKLLFKKKNGGIAIVRHF